jgi:predicted permease
MHNVNQQFLLSTLIIVLGFALKKGGVIGEEDGAALAKILFNVSLPAVVISTFSTMQFERSLIVLPGHQHCFWCVDVRGGAACFP